MGDKGKSDVDAAPVAAAPVAGKPIRLIRRVRAGRYEGAGLVVERHNRFGTSWQVYKKDRNGSYLGGYTSLAELLFHKGLQIEATK